MTISKRIRVQLLIISVLTFRGACGDECSQETKRTGLPILSGGFGKAAAPFLIADTGSKVCLASQDWTDINLVEDDGFRQKLVSTSGTATLELLRQIPVHVEPMKEKPLDVGLFDFSRLSRVLDRHLDGVIVMPYLKDYVLEYSASSGCKLLARLPDAEPGAFVVPLRNAQILPEIEVEIPGLGKRWLILDTGSMGGICLNSRRFNLLQRMRHISSFGTIPRFDAQGKIVTAKAFVTRWVKIGGIQFQNVNVDESPTEAIGMGLLHHFRMVLDFRGGQAFLYFQGAEKICPMLPEDASGLAVNIKTNGRLGVIATCGGSPASDIGMRSRDEVIEIDGVRPETLNYWEVYDILSQAGKSIPLTVVRDGKTMEMQMQLRHTVPFPLEWPPEKPEFNPEP